MADQSTQLTYRVDGMTCGHCKSAVERELSSVDGVKDVDVDLGSKLVTVVGEKLDDEALRSAIDEAGYDAVAETNSATRQ